jgi:TetR/AcrR family transcriptional regulator
LVSHVKNVLNLVTVNYSFMAKDVKQNKKEAVRLKNQQKILEAAEKLFAQTGYDGASMSMIAKEADVPKANVLYYFKSKDNLYETVLDNIVGAWNLGLKDVTVDDDPAETLFNYIQSKVRFAIDKPAQSRLFASEIIRGAPYLKNYIRNNTRPWVREKVALFQVWIDAGKIQDIDPYHLLFTIWSTTQYYADFQAEVLLVMNRIEYENSDVDSITQSIAQIILRGIGLDIPKIND